jgi:hypothetical protein
VPTDHEQLRDALKRAAAALADSEVPFALAGSYALWVHGAQEPSHDVDLAIVEDDAERAGKALAGAGFDVERPPEDWLLKAHRDDVLVDLLFRLNGRPVELDLLESAGVEQVLGMWMRVLPATRIVIAKLRALNEHYCDFGTLLPPVRAVREQLDWNAIEAATQDNDFAVAFLVLARRLGLIPQAAG